LGVLVSVGFAVYFAIYAYMSFRQVEYSQKRQKDETLLYEDIDDTLGNVFTILGHNQLPFEKGLLEGRSRRFNSVFESEMIENARLKFIASLMNVALFVLFISFALSLYRNRGIDQATAIGLLTMIMFLVKHIRGLARRVSEGLVSLGNLREGDVYLRRLSSVGKRGWKRDVIKTGRIRFEGVNFRYPDNRTDSLRDVTFEISPGENVVVIGKSGSGKSTVLKLLMGFYQVYRGRISIDSTDVRTIDPGHLRSNIKYLGQNVRLFNRPIIDNIIYGTGVDREKAKRVVNSLKVGRVLSSRNLEELAGKFGDNLSGGQKQMVQLIRSYLDRSRLVLLDEPTSAIDPHHKRDVVRVIRHLMSTRQVVLVTHDWSLIGMFPRVIYMDRGRVLYDGPTSGFSPPRDGGA